MAAFRGIRESRDVPYRTPSTFCGSGRETLQRSKMRISGLRALGKTHCDEDAETNLVFSMTGQSVAWPR